jgi:hypothetical protein
MRPIMPLTAFIFGLLSVTVGVSLRRRRVETTVANRLCEHVTDSTRLEVLMKG